MASEWEVCKVGDVARLQGGYAFKSKDFSDFGIPVVKIKNVRKKDVDLSDVARVSKKVAEQASDLYVKKWDVLISMTGSGPNAPASIVGRVARHSGEDNLFLINQRVGRFLIKDKNRLDQRFLYYLLSPEEMQLKLLSIATGSANQVNISGKQVESIDVSLPALKEQKAIAHILGTLDDKIEINRQMNETLEAMAQTLFKSWFVDFDPVIDNALAAGKSLPDKLLERAEQRQAVLDGGKTNQAISDLFPDEFEFTEELGWIPKGWETKPIYEAANFINGSSFKSQYFTEDNQGLPIIKIAEIKSGISKQTKFTTQEMAEKYAINDGAILFSWSGNPDTSIDTFIWTGGDGWLNQHIFNVVLKQETDRTFVYYLLKYLKPIFTEIARDKQTTGLGHVTVKDMKRIYTIAPSAEILEAFSLYVNPIFKRWYGNLFSSNELSKIRDTLLPKLLSGELSIPDAERLVDEVL